MNTQPFVDRKSWFIVVTILIVVAVTQSTNLFQFPYYQDNEGTVISNSWSLIQEGKLSPYT
ncbi:MAG: hypothetical protein DIU68_016015, partial [Chloroflexota bacterium]